VHHQDGRSGQEFQREIAVGDRIEGVAGHIVELQLFGDIFPVDGEGCSRQGAGAEREYVEAFRAILHAPPVTPEHLHVGQHVVGEQDGLGHLEMGVAGHYHAQVLFRLKQERVRQEIQVPYNLRNLVTQVEADINSHLIVSGTARVEPFSRLADGRRQPRLDVHVDVFQGNGEVEFSCLDARQDLFQSGNDGVHVGHGYDLLSPQHPGMGDGTPDVLAVQALVEIDGGGELLDEFIGGLGKTSSPEFVLGHAISCANS